MQGGGHVLRGLLPLLDYVAVTLLVRHEAHFILGFNVQDLLFRVPNHLVLLGRNGHVGDRNRDGGPG